MLNTGPRTEQVGKEEFAKAVSEDFGHRSREQTLMTDIMPSVSALKHAKKHMASWSKGEKRKPTFPLGMLGAKAEVVYQPKGVVGTMLRGVLGKKNC